MSDFASERTGDVPGNDITADTMEAARFKSSGCAFCFGQGWATIFRFDYDGRAVIRVLDCDGVERLKAMRTVAYCKCAAGQKMLALHRESAKDVYQVACELDDVLHEHYPSWTVDDPTDDCTDEGLQGWSPEQRDRLANSMRVRRKRTA